MTAISAPPDISAQLSQRVAAAHLRLEAFAGSIDDPASWVFALTSEHARVSGVEAIQVRCGDNVALELSQRATRSAISPHYLPISQARRHVAEFLRFLAVKAVKEVAVSCSAADAVFGTLLRDTHRSAAGLCAYARSLVFHSSWFTAQLHPLRSKWIATHWRY